MPLINRIIESVTLRSLGRLSNCLPNISGWFRIYCAVCSGESSDGKA